MARGNFDGQGDDKYEGIYNIKAGGRLGVIDFINRHSPELIRKVLYAAFIDLHTGRIDWLWVVMHDADDVRQKAFSDTMAIVAPELRAKVALTVCAPDKIEEAAAYLQIEKQRIQPSRGSPAQVDLRHWISFRGIIFSSFGWCGGTV
jgi:hypothetical protein